MREALARRDVTLVFAAPSLAARQSARTTLFSTEQRELQLSHQLAALLGLLPDAATALSRDVILPPFDADEIRAALPDLPRRRPDLLALRLGYAARDESLRQAVLAQFPDLVLGASATSDSSKVVNFGPEGMIGLPVFDRNQSGIAVARATREQLRREYLARLDATAGEVGCSPPSRCRC
jgi:outer membrane protein TolC